MSTTSNNHVLAPRASRAARSSAELGQSLGGLLLSILLLLLVLGEVVFLATHYRGRLDFTSDKEYTLTSSTRNVIDGLTDRLLIEAYFTKEDKLPTVLRDSRQALVGILDEYQQISRGKVVVQYFDPQSDNALQQKAERLGMQAQALPGSSGEAISVQMVWQGVRLRYHGDKQKVIPFVQFAQSPFQYESQLTPDIKDLTVKDKPKVGFLAFATQGARPNPMMPQQQGDSKGFERIKEAIKGRYDVVDLDLNEGKLIPADVKIVLLIRPKSLTDRQKYAFDQFLMKGGKLLVFADTAEYELGQRRSFIKHDVSYDSPDSKLKFLDQLAHYGAKVEDKVVADLAGQTAEAFALMVPQFGYPQPEYLHYPYWFHSVNGDWSKVADKVAAMFADGNGGSEERAKEYRETFKPGMASDNVALKGMAARLNQGPGMYWPCPVGLTDKLPEGVTGQVLLRTSPLALVETPPQSLDALGTDRAPAVKERNWRQFYQKMNQRLASEPRQQVPLMVALEGKFSSFFDGKEIPAPKPKPVASAAPSLPVRNPLDEPIGAAAIKKDGDGAKPAVTGSQGVGSKPEAPGTEKSEPQPQTRKSEAPTNEHDKTEEKSGAKTEPKTEPKKEPKKDGTTGGGTQPDATGKEEGHARGDKRGGPRIEQNAGLAGQGDLPKQEPAKQEPAKQAEAKQEPSTKPAAAHDAAQQRDASKPAVQGPTPPAGAAVDNEKDKDPAPVFKGESTMLVVVGDSDLIRDDLVTGEYQQAGGPISQYGYMFFANVLDWLASDTDLVALRNKQPVDRRLSFASTDMLGDTNVEAAQKSIKQRADFFRWANIAGPVVALLLIGLVVLLWRRAQKHSFITSTES